MNQQELAALIRVAVAEELRRHNAEQEARLAEVRKSIAAIEAADARRCADVHVRSVH